MPPVLSKFAKSDDTKNKKGSAHTAKDMKADKKVARTGVSKHPENKEYRFVKMDYLEQRHKLKKGEELAQPLVKPIKNYKPNFFVERSSKATKFEMVHDQLILEGLDTSYDLDDTYDDIYDDSSDNELDMDNDRIESDLDINSLINQGLNSLSKELDLTEKDAEDSSILLSM